MEKKQRTADEIEKLQLIKSIIRNELKIMDEDDLIDYYEETRIGDFASLTTKELKEVINDYG